MPFDSSQARAQQEDGVILEYNVPLLPAALLASATVFVPSASVVVLERGASTITVRVPAVDQATNATISNVDLSVDGRLVYSGKFSRILRFPALF